MVFVSDTGSQQKRAQGNDHSGVSVEQKQPGYLAAYAQLWPTPAEGWRLHHGPWTPPLGRLLITDHHSFSDYTKNRISEYSRVVPYLNLTKCFFCLSEMQFCFPLVQLLQPFGGPESCYSPVE